MDPNEFVMNHYSSLLNYSESVVNRCESVVNCSESPANYIDFAMIHQLISSEL